MALWIALWMKGLILGITGAGAQGNDFVLLQVVLVLSINSVYVLPEAYLPV